MMRSFQPRSSASRMILRPDLMTTLFTSSCGQRRLSWSPERTDIGKVVGVKPTSKTANCPEPGEEEIQGTRWRGDRAGRRLHLRLRLACLQPRRKTQAFDVSAHSLQDGERRHDQQRRPADDRTDLATGDVLPPIPPISAWDKEEPGRGRGTGPETAEHRRHRGGRRAPLCRASDAECRRRYPYCQRACRSLFANGDRPLPAEVVRASKEREIRLHFDNPNTGIRDLAALPNSGGLLVLTGPTLAQDDTSYDLYWIRELKPHASIEHLLTIPTGARPKCGTGTRWKWKGKQRRRRA